MKPKQLQQKNAKEAKGGRTESKSAEENTSLLRFLCFLCVLAVLVSGCALSKPPPQAELVTNALPVATIPSAWFADGITNLVVNDWLKAFNDANLEAIVAEAITNNLNLREAAERVEMARQNVVVVGSQMKPQIGVDLGLGATRDDGHDNWYSSKKGVAGVAWEPDVWGKLRAQRGAAEAGYQATALDYAFARQSLAATTAKAWYLATEANQLARARRTECADLLRTFQPREDSPNRGSSGRSRSRRSQWKLERRRKPTARFPRTG